MYTSLSFGIILELHVLSQSLTPISSFSFLFHDPFLGLLYMFCPYITLVCLRVSYSFLLFNSETFRQSVLIYFGQWLDARIAVAKHCPVKNLRLPSCYKRFWDFGIRKDIKASLGKVEHVHIRNRRKKNISSQKKNPFKALEEAEYYFQNRKRQFDICVKSNITQSISRDGP